MASNQPFYMDYDFNYLSQQEQIFQQFGNSSSLIHDNQQQDALYLDYMTDAERSKSTLLVPRSPDPFQYDENVDTSYCTSPISILSNTSLNKGANLNLQSFPSPVPSPYQHASETVPIYGLTSHPMTTTSNDNQNINNTVVIHPSTNTTISSDSVLGQALQTESANFCPQLFLSYSSSSSTSDSSLPEPSMAESKKPEKIQDKNNDKFANSELRRQIHIQSEQKRRAQIKDGFEDLRNELPSYLNKKMSKVALLHRTVQHIQHLKNTQVAILAELKRLAKENEQLKKLQQDTLHKQMCSSSGHAL